MTEISLEILRIWSSGGWVMIPLCLLAILIYSTSFDLILYLKNYNLKVYTNQNLKAWILDPDQAPKQVKEIVLYTQENVTTSQHLRNRFEEIEKNMLNKVDHKLTFLNTLVVSAPLMGLLGTVIGMLGTFSALSSGAGSETVDMVAAGISEALITTQTGLFIALPSIFLLLIIKRQKNAIASVILRLESQSLNTLNFR